MIFKTNNLNTLLPSLWRRSWGWGFLLLVFLALPLTSAAAKKKAHEPNDRQYWCSLAYRMAQPVLENMAKGELQKNMQTEFSPSFDNRKVLYMECFGRLMAGIAPWLTLPDDNTAEGKQRKQLREWALLSYKNAVDPQSADYLCWGIGGQNLVDGAYIAESFLRAYDTLWMPLDEQTKQRSFPTRRSSDLRVSQASQDRPSVYQLAPLLVYNREFYG